MGGFEPPSFSLGLDFDSDSEPQPNLEPDPPPPQPQRTSITTSNLHLLDEFNDDFESSSPGYDPKNSDTPTRTFKRLRRGSSSGPTQSVRKFVPMEVGEFNDDIEEFSSQEDRYRAEEPASTQYQSMWSSSKFSLRGNGFLTTELANKGKETTREHVINTPAFANTEASDNKMMFKKLTVSPLRRFQLIDSDSDDPSVSEGLNMVSDKVDSYLKERQSKSGQHKASQELGDAKVSVSMYRREDLWKDFCTEKNFCISTPALDEVCDEYYRSLKDKNGTQNKHCRQSGRTSKKDEQQQGDGGNPLPPAHRYFYNDDPRIQKLVRTRLHNFFPLGAVQSTGLNQPVAPEIDINQFGHGEGSKRAAGKTKAGVGQRKNRKNSKKPNAEELPQGSGSWVSPKHSAEIPKDAGKRRVHAVGQSAGHWYTGQDGKRVYVNKSGQELTGRIAYRHYRKESGAGFKRLKKKTASKKKTKQ